MAQSVKCPMLKKGKSNKMLGKRLTDKQKNKIKQQYNSGRYTYKSLAKIYNTSASTITRVTKMKT